MARILITVHKFFPQHKAGTEVLTLKIAKELLNRGHEILVVSCDPPDQDARHATGPESQDYEYDGIKVHAIGESLRLKNYSYQHEFIHPEIGEHFASVLNQFKPDLVHIMHAQNLSARVIEKAKELGLRVILSPTDFWFICPIVQLKRTDGTICRGPGPDAEHCITCYTPELLPPQEQFVEAFKKKIPMGGLLGDSLIGNLFYKSYLSKKEVFAKEATRQRPGALKEIGNKVDAITVPTEIMKELFVENGFRQELIHKIPFGIDTSLLEPFQTKVASDKIRIGFIGTIYEHKGLDILIEAFQMLDPGTRSELKIYGSTEQFPEYASQVQELAQSKDSHKSKIRFLGTFKNQDLGKVLTEIDVLVVPSRWYENTPLVMQSALATKTPLIVTDLGGMSELVKDGVNGLTFSLNDPKDLASKLARVESEPDLLEQFRSNIDNQRTVENMVDDLEKFYFPA